MASAFGPSLGIHPVHPILFALLAAVLAAAAPVRAQDEGAPSNTEATPGADAGAAPAAPDSSGNPGAIAPPADTVAPPPSPTESQYRFQPRPPRNGKLSEFAGLVAGTVGEDSSLWVKKGPKSQEEMFKLTAETAITRDGQPLALADLAKGMRVTVKYWTQDEMKVAAQVRAGAAAAAPKKKRASRG